MMNGAIDIENREDPGQKQQRTRRRLQGQRLCQHVEGMSQKAGRAAADTNQAQYGPRRNQVPQLQHQRYSVAGRETEYRDAFDKSRHRSRLYSNLYITNIYLECADARNMVV